MGVFLAGVSGTAAGGSGVTGKVVTTGFDGAPGTRSARASERMDEKV